jgi:6-pyruvoyl-tetrahydropterin synthase
MTTLFVHNLTVIDAARLDPERGVVGESWLVDVELEGTLNPQSMVLDFGDVKRQVKEAVDRDFDHRLLIPAGYRECRIENLPVEMKQVTLRGAFGQIRHLSPEIAIAEIDTERVDADSVAAAIQAQLGPSLPDNVTRFRIHLHHEEITGACFQYTHGLRKHAGSCQRIAHGHRSRLEIYRDGARDRELENRWGQRWKEVYIASRTDIIASSEQGGVTYIHLGYTTHEGRFEIELPEERCYLIDADSTIENLAQHLAERLKQEQPESDFRVRLFEGVNKGAIAEA